VRDTQLTPKGYVLTPRESVFRGNLGLCVFTTIVIDLEECVRPVLSRFRCEHVGMGEGGRRHDSEGNELAKHDNKEMKRRS
jgi:hypothetical protein